MIIQAELKKRLVENVFVTLGHGIMKIKKVLRIQRAWQRIKRRKRVWITSILMMWDENLYNIINELKAEKEKKHNMKIRKNDLDRELESIRKGNKKSSLIYSKEGKARKSMIFNEDSKSIC